jgi:EAL and modified HD-GYP domain-containing signal transduction protein
VKLLRYLNSAGFGWRHEVTTIRQALRILGERPMKKWASLVALTMLGEDKPVELVVTSMVRAQFCEQIGLAGALPGREADLFLAGLLSTLDALLDQPMEQVLSKMAVPADIKATLLGRPTRLAEVLALATAYDRGDWERVGGIAQGLGVPDASLPGLYRQSIDWVTKILND